MQKQEDKERIRKKAIRLFMDHYDFVRFTAFLNAPRKSLQSDIINDAFLEFVDNAERYDLQKEIRPLLRSITKNMALRYWRNIQQESPEMIRKIFEHLEKIKDRFSTPERDLEDEFTILDFCISKLSPENQNLLERHYFDKKTLEELSKAFAQSGNALRKRMGRIRLLLRRCIERALKGGSDLD